MDGGASSIAHRKLKIIMVFLTAIGVRMLIAGISTYFPITK
jgi:hypothetical protein